MSGITISSSSDSTKKAIDEYYDESSDNSSDTSSNSSRGNTTDEEYVSGVPGLPLEEVQKQLRKTIGSQVGTSSSIPPSSSLDETEVTVYSCAVDIPSKTDEERLNNLRGWYQIPDEFNPRLPVRGEWCCNPHFGIGVYEAYLLGGLRFPSNSFTRELLVRLGLGVCQFNPNAWRLIISMQILWREVFGRDRPITVDEFLYCYKPSEIHQSPGFYQFTARSKNCRLVKSLASSDRKWKTEFFFVSGFWAGNPVDVGRNSFGRFTRDLGNLRPEAVGRPILSKLHRDRVHRACLHTDRDFHSLVNLRRLAKWGLGPNVSDIAFAHEITVRKRMATMRGNKGKEVNAEGSRPELDRQARPVAGEKRKTISKHLDLENLPSRRGKKPTKVYDIDSSTPVESTLSKTPPSRTVPTSSQPSQRALSNIIENEDLAWERFKNAVTDEDINICYDMSLKDFEHSGVHDLFKGMSKFIAASRHATGLDKTRILLETRIQELKEEARQWAEVAAKTTDEAKDLKALVEELKANAAEKDARLEDL
nr:hypothetical protein CFP56_39864 [Quercus suber]